MIDEERIKNLETELNALKLLIPKLVSPQGIIEVGMSFQEMLVRIQNKGKVTVDVSTTKVEGQILFCALKDLERKPFTSAEISSALDDRGWHTNPTTLSKTLSRLTIEKGFLIKADKGYRLPEKVEFTGDEL